MKETRCLHPGKDPGEGWVPDLDRGGSQKAAKSDGVLSFAAQGVNSAVRIVFFKIRTYEIFLMNQEQDQKAGKNLN